MAKIYLMYRSLCIIVVCGTLECFLLLCFRSLIGPPRAKSKDGMVDFAVGKVFLVKQIYRGTSPEGAYQRE